MIPPIAPGQADDNEMMVGWKNTFNMRQISLMNLAATQFGKNGTRSSLPTYRRAYSITSPTKSLDLLRQNLQNAINKDIDNVIKKYLDKFFQPAINNIRNNLGVESVNDDHIKDVCKQILEEAKAQYTVTTSRDSSPFDFSDSETSLLDGKVGSSSPCQSKRKESDTDSEKNMCVYKRHKSRCTSSGIEYTSHKLPIKREGPKWDPSRIQSTTLFIMGARANKVLGYGQTRGRLYVRHPNLLRYSGDQEDKEWLASKNLMPPSGGKAYLMLLEDIRELTETDDYRTSPNVQLHELRGFEVPEFLLVKIRTFVDYVRTDKICSPLLLSSPSANLDLLDFRSPSITPPTNSNDSGPSTPSDAGTPIPSTTSSLMDTQGECNSTSSFKSSFVNISEASSNFNQSVLSSLLGNHSSDNSEDY